MKMPQLYKAWVEENQNYKPGTGNLFLHVELFDRKRGFYERCIGGADQDFSGKWIVTVSAPYNEETDSDALFIGSYDTQDEARLALLRAKDLAYLS
jgi:hypothetical protein